MEKAEATLKTHQLELATQLIDDIELSRLPQDQILFKAYRLSRISDEEEIRKWLFYELNGYPNTDEGKTFMDRVWRWTDKAKNYGWWNPFSAINGLISSMQLQMQQLKIPDIHYSVASANPNEFVTGFGHSPVAASATTVLQKMNELTSSITTLNSIKSRVLMGIHIFASDIYYRFAFSNVAETIFNKYKTKIDSLLRENAESVLDKIPSIYDRLLNEDQEAISQAMNSCRRMIKAFADSVYPPRDEIVKIDGKEYQIGNDKDLNRIELFCIENLDSKSRIERLNKSLRLIHDRTSVGTHRDISSDEAKALFLHTYIILGEILESKKKMADPKEQEKRDV